MESTSPKIQKPNKQERNYRLPPAALPSFMTQNDYHDLGKRIFYCAVYCVLDRYILLVVKLEPDPFLQIF